MSSKASPQSTINRAPYFIIKKISCLLSVSGSTKFGVKAAHSIITNIKKNVRCTQIVKGPKGALNINKPNGRSSTPINVITVLGQFLGVQQQLFKLVPQIVAGKKSLIPLISTPRSSLNRGLLTLISRLKTRYVANAAILRGSRGFEVFGSLFLSDFNEVLLPGSSNYKARLAYFRTIKLTRFRMKQIYSSQLCRKRK